MAIPRNSDYAYGLMDCDSTGIHRERTESFGNSFRPQWPYGETKVREGGFEIVQPATELLSLEALPVETFNHEVLHIGRIIEDQQGHYDFSDIGLVNELAAFIADFGLPYSMIRNDNEIALLLERCGTWKNRLLSGVRQTEAIRWPSHLETDDSHLSGADTPQPRLFISFDEAAVVLDIFQTLVRWTLDYPTRFSTPTLVKGKPVFQPDGSLLASNAPELVCVRRFFEAGSGVRTYHNLPLFAGREIAEVHQDNGTLTEALWMQLSDTVNTDRRRWRHCEYCGRIFKEHRKMNRTTKTSIHYCCTTCLNYARAQKSKKARQRKDEFEKAVRKGAKDAGLF